MTVDLSKWRVEGGGGVESEIGGHWRLLDVGRIDGW